MVNDDLIEFYWQVQKFDLIWIIDYREFATRIRKGAINEINELSHKACMEADIL